MEWIGLLAHWLCVLLVVYGKYREHSHRPPCFWSGCCEQQRAGDSQCRELFNTDMGLELK